MINAIKIFLVAGEKSRDFTVGTDGVTKIFPDKENPRNIIILTDEGIIEYGNVAYYIASKDYKKEVIK